VNLPILLAAWVGLTILPPCYFDRFYRVFLLMAPSARKSLIFTFLCQQGKVA
jgi:hypothetical protein